MNDVGFSGEPNKFGGVAVADDGRAIFCPRTLSVVGILSTSFAQRFPNCEESVKCCAARAETWGLNPPETCDR